MTFDAIKLIVAQCHFPDYTFSVKLDGRGSWYLQGSYEEPDTVTGEPSVQKTRRWLLSPEMTKSEVVNTTFKCLMTSQEHKAREWFKWRGRAIYQPHYDVDQLFVFCEDEDKR